MVFWHGWLQRANDGDQEAAGHIHSLLADAVAQSNMPAPYRDFLAPALRAIGGAAPGAARVAAAKKHLLFARKRGRRAPYQVKERAQRMAQAVWDKVGEASGARLDRACEEVAFEFGIGRPGNRAPDIRGVKLAYLEWLPTFLEIQKESQRI